jgi:uncharacterized glyoxalase superfamily protein PhnB
MLYAGKPSGNLDCSDKEIENSTFHAALTDKFGVDWNIVAEETPNNP